MEVMDGTPDNSTYTIPDSYTTTVHAEQSNWWYTHHFSSEDTMFWDRVNTTQQRSYSTDLTALASEAFVATVRGELAAWTFSSVDNPDHHTLVWLNNTNNLVDEAYWDGKSRYRFETQIPKSALIEGQNQLLFSVRFDAYPGQLTDRIYFDWFEIEYPRRFQAQDDRITYQWNENGETWRYVINGFSDPSVEAYEITNPLTPRRVTGSTLNPGTLTFEGEQPGAVAYTAIGVNAALSPKSLTYYDPPDLKSSTNGADYLIITHANLLTPVQPLALYRSAQGLDTMIVDVADVYNEFNDGIFHSIAIKNFLRYAYENWIKRPTYVLLIGDGHWNFYGSTVAYPVPPQLLPPHLAWVDPWQGEVDSSNLLAAVAGTDILPDMLISRIPVNDAAELDVVIDKIIAYEASGQQEWQRHILYIADNPDEAGDFEAYIDQIIQDYHQVGFTDDRIFTEDVCGDTCANTINNQISTIGATLVTYVGHGAISLWGGSPALYRVTDISGLTNDDRLPILLSMTCLDGYSFHAGEQGLVESLLRAVNKGIVGAFSPTGLGVATGHDALQRGFYDSLFQDGDWGLGQAALSGKLRLFNTGSDDDLIQTFTIYGDPAMRIQNPYAAPEVDPSPSVKSGVAGKAAIHTLQVTNTGIVSDTFDITVEGNLWSVTAPASVGPVFPGGNLSFDVGVTIPAGATLGEMDFSTLRIVSRGDNTETTSVVLQTVVGQAISLYLPSVTK
jgi:hypothetical protein